MKPESFLQLIGSGNAATVDEEWMRLLDTPDLALDQLAKFSVVLSELRRLGRTAQAEELAWAATEALSGRYPPRETLTVAGPFLLAVGQSEELRGQVEGLYRSAYDDVEGLDALLSEAGLSGGRPVRRALRTLDLCLPLEKGDFLVARDDDGAARVNGIDRAAWRFSITTGDGADTLGAVHLADRFRPAPQSDFRVMRAFAPEQLAKQLWTEPTPIIIDICKRRENGIDSDALETTLVPDLVSIDDWKKWWTRTRNALRRCPNVRIDGRTPAVLTYVEVPVALEDDLVKALEDARGLLARWELIDKYLRECRARNTQPSEPVLRRSHDSFRKMAEELSGKKPARAGLAWLLAVRVGRVIGINAVPDEVVSLFGTCPDLGELFAQIEDETLFDLACECLDLTGREDWPDQLLTLLPALPLTFCDRAVKRLIVAGRSSADFEPVVQQIMGSPVRYFEALLWLWNGPAAREDLPVPGRITLLSRLVRTLNECRRSEAIPKEDAKRISSRARSVLSARKYQQFDRCLEELDAGMAVALRTQIGQLDNLGRAVREDLLKRLNRRFPVVRAKEAAAPWEREDVLFVTGDGLSRKRKEIDHHVNVKMRENARAIGRAAEHGDLSENSEYKFALEERDLLRARLAQMNAEVAIARVMTPTDVPTDRVGIGTKVYLRRVTDGECYDISLLGPWEADRQSRRFNYLTPLAQKVLGKAVGDTVEFDHTGAAGTYEIVALESALASDGTEPRA